MNQWVGYGNLGSDPEVKTLNSGKKVAKLSFATNETFTNNSGEKTTETQWHQVIYWDKLAELCEKYLKKGSSLIVIGKISYRSYTNKDGATVYVTEIVGNEMHFTGSKEAKEPKAEAPQAQEKWHGKQPVKSMSNIDELPQHVQDAENVPDDNLPF